MVQARPPLSRGSPSSASTSSLALLREKLSVLPGYSFDKEPVSVVAAPQLSRLTEHTEHTEHNDTFATYKLRTYGVCKHKYQRVDGTSHGGEAGNKCTTTSNDSDENSISCLLVATIGSNESVINDTLQRLPGDRKVHTDNIVELLAQEALDSNGPQIYGRVVTDEKTQSEGNGDDIEGIQRPTTFLNKKTNASNTATVEDVQVINDHRGIGSVPLASEENKRTTYDIQTVEDFFSQHCSSNRNDDLLISPTLAKKINETSSESSLDFDIHTPVIIDNETNQYDVHFNSGNAEIIECINDMVDKIVCENLKNCMEHTSKEKEHLNFCNKDFPTMTPLKKNQNMSKNTNKNQKKNIRLQYKNTKTRKNRGKNQNKLATEDIKRMTTIVEKDSDVEKTLQKNSSPESNSLQLNDYEMPIIKRKRKLYSPKDDNAVNERTGIHISETEDDYSILPETATVDTTPKAQATSYKDIEKIRISARNLRIRKSEINLSPKTKKNNDIFDNLKKSVVGEGQIILADKKISTRNKNLAVYNFSSDSEDDDFQKKKGVRKSSTVGCVGSAKSTRARKSNNQKKNKHVKRRKSKSNLKQQVPDLRNEIIDERIREAAAEALNTSFVIEQQNDLLPKALEPIIKEKPQMEIIEDVKDLPTRRTSRRKRPTNPSLKKENVTHKDKNVSSDREPSVRSSPLPGLTIETVQVQVHKDPDDSINTAMLEKFKDICNNEPLPDISGINTTHNLLSDLEQITYDSIVSEELNTTNRSIVSKRLRNDILNKSPEAKKCKSNTSKVREAIEPQIITLSDVSDAKSDKSIATLGKSPITGHGDCDESPPNTEQLQQRYEPRGLETQDFNQSMKNYFNSLTKDIYEASQSCQSKKKMDKTINAKELEKSPIKLMKDMSIADISPTVSIARLSPKEVGRWLPARFNSIFGSDQSSVNNHPVRITRSHTRSREGEKKNEPKSTTSKSLKMDFRKSAISPIKMFGEINKKRSLTPEHNDYVEEIKDITTKHNISKTVNTKSNSSRYDLRKYSAKTVSSKNSTNVDCSYTTRRSPTVLEASKKEKTGSFISDVESGQSSSINEWLNRNELQHRSQAERAELSLKDNLENTIEKLETTLTEIHHKTSKKFVSMFVDAQKHLTDLKEKRRQLYKQTALEVMSDFVKVMDEKFGELERRSQDLDRQFMDGLKQSAGDVMRADCDQKRAMVTLLKEDVQTALNHFNKSGRTNL